ncbi:hypothetical protein EV121DRAFT_267049 [Schizophyllum commune]
MYRRPSLLGAAALVSLAAAAAQDTTVAFTDPNTGIDFQAFSDSNLGYQFGIALPETITTDFIGQLVVPLNGTAGWAGVSFGEHMVGPLLLAAWANAGSVVSSFRKASQYAQPPPYSNTSVSLSPISTGTYINATHASLTFVCGGCVDDVLSFSPSDSSTTMAYAVSYTSPQTPGSANASLSFHGAGFGQFTVLLSDAKSPEYESWAAMAGS